MTVDRDNASLPPKAGVMGWPVEHSLSPHIHRYWLGRYGIAGDYLLIPVPPEDFVETARGLARDGFVGANVTVPHKLAAFEAADEVSAVARRIGAVNTLYYRDGRLIGTNTDGTGFLENLRQGAPGWDPGAGPAVVLGAGGAARAVAVALLEAGVPELRLLNRTRARAEALADALGGPITVADWAARSETLAGAALLVNTTSLGMVGQGPLELALEALPRRALVNDIVYRPLETDLLARARARGNPVVDGLGMLLHQARPGFELWFGRAPEVTEELRQLVLEAAA